MGTYAVYDRHSRPTPTTTPSIPRQLDSLVVLLPAVPHHRQLPQVRHSPSPSGFGTANPRPLQLLSSIQELMYFYMRPDHTSFQASTILRSAQSATHTIDPQKIKNHKDRVSKHIPGSTIAAHVLSNSYHLQIITIRTSFASAADAVPPRPRPYRKLAHRVCPADLQSPVLTK